jgi:hypothetical protein
MITKKLFWFHILGIAFAFFFGSLLHFIYNWSGENPFIALFGAVNESTWEHLKLLFWAVTVFAVIEYFAYGKTLPGLLPAKALSIVTGMIVIVAVFYTYTGVLGTHYFFADLLTFALGCAAAYTLSYVILKNKKLGSPAARIAGTFLYGVLLLCFIVLTFAPPHIGLFLDPGTLKYGTL